MSNELEVKFWGVRGSYPTPGRETVRYGGNTSSVEVRAGNRTIIFDAGTGIIPLGRELARTRRAGEILLLFSHLHHDHTQGFPYFVPAYMSNAKLHIFGPDGTHESMKNVLDRNQSSETFPVGLRDMASAKDIQAVRDSQIVIWDEQGVRVAESVSGPALSHVEGLGDEAVVIHIHKSYAHPGGVYVYRIIWHGKSVVYATDTEGYIGTDKRLVKFAQGADLLIHDAQYLDEHYRGQLDGFPATQGFGHSTFSMACEVAAAARVGGLILFHHDPAYSDEMLAGMERTAQSLFANSATAYEGLEVTLTPGPVSATLRDDSQSPHRRGESNVAGQLQSPATYGRDVQYAQNG